MEKCLFNPKTIQCPEDLVLIPFFIDRAYYRKLRKSALKTFNLLTSEMLVFESYAVLSGFLGYPNLLTLLQFIENINQKNIFFLGTAGALDINIYQPTSLNVTVIYSSEILDYLSDDNAYTLKSFESRVFPQVKGVTVDIIQRETLSWLKDQVKKGMQIVEMELFPLRAYLQKPFFAVVVTTDKLKETGGEVFQARSKVKEEFIRSFRFIVDYINEGEHR
jgi:hypothetical protein